MSMHTSCTRAGRRLGAKRTQPALRPVVGRHTGPSLFILLTVLYGAASQAQPSKPNVVFIMTDDVGYGDLGAYGAPDIKTPVLDQLARDGVRFTDFYSNGATCSPTRTGFVMGRYQQRYGVEAPLPIVDATGHDGIAAEGYSIGTLMKSAGYDTALIGKWHLGSAEDRSPKAHGFDYFFGFKSGYIDYWQHTNGIGEPDLYEDDRLIHEDGYMTDLITERSVRYIREHADEPFFLSIQYNAAHWPYQRPDVPSVAVRDAAHLMPQDLDTSMRADYVAILERADQGIGAVLQALEDAGISDDTLLIFTNDNGGEWLSRNAPLFHRKGSVWEGGIRVPAMMRWPGVIPAGTVTPQVGITMDFTATILAVAGAALPQAYEPEGIDLLPIVSGEADVVERTLFWRNRSSRAVRSGDLKLVVASPRTSFIFDVRKDPGERNDLTNVLQTDVRRMYGLLDAWVEDVDAENETRDASETAP